MKKRLVAIVLCILVTLCMVASVKGAESLTIYVDDGNADYLAELLVQGEKDADTLIELLEQQQMVPEGTKVNSFEITKEGKRTIGKLDLSKEYEKAVTHTGTAGERMYIYSVVNTFIKNLELDQVYLTADGEIISTGHAIYDEALNFYDHIIAAKDWSGNSVSTQSVDGSGNVGDDQTSESTEEAIESKNNTENGLAGPTESVDTKESTNINENQVTAKAQEPLQTENGSAQSIMNESDTKKEQEMMNAAENQKEVTKQKSFSDTIRVFVQGLYKQNVSMRVILFVIIGAIVCLFFGTFLHVVKKKKL